MICCYPMMAIPKLTPGKAPHGKKRSSRGSAHPQRPSTAKCMSACSPWLRQFSYIDIRRRVGTNGVRVADISDLRGSIAADWVTDAASGAFDH